MEKVSPKKSKATLAYVGIVGGLALISFALFTVSAFFGSKLTASKSQLSVATNEMTNMLAEQPDCLTDAMLTYHDRALWFNDLVTYFTKESETNNKVYIATAVPAYTCTILTLVSFGLCLKDADKRKEKEDKQ